MKKLTVLVFVTLIIYSCSKNNNTSSRPSNIDTAHLPADTSKMPTDTAVFSPDSANVLGNWHVLNYVDSEFHLDGTFYTALHFNPDTSVSGYEQCNTINFTTDGYYLSYTCASPGPNPGFTYYAYVSPYSFSEEYAGFMPGQHDSIPYDTAFIQQLTDKKMFLSRNYFRNDSPDESYTHRNIEVYFR